MPSSDQLVKSFDSVPKLSNTLDFVKWEQRMELAFSLTLTSAYVEKGVPPHPATRVDASGAVTKATLSDTQIEENEEWNVRDHQVAAAILSTCSEAILSANLRYLKLPTSRAYGLMRELRRKHGSEGAQHAFAVGRRFVDNKCGEGADVEAWVNDVTAQHCELQVLKFDLDVLCVNVLLTGLPSRFESFVTQTWTATDIPTIDSFTTAILRINAGHKNQKNEDQALAAVNPADSAESLDFALAAVYDRARRAGKKPGKEHPCARCGSHTHWVVECPKPASESQKTGRKRGGRGAKGKDGGGHEGATQSETVNVAYDTYKGDAHEHVLVAGPDLHALATLRMDGWLLDSGASAHMTGDRSWLCDVKALASPAEICVASGTSLRASSAGSVRLVNHDNEVVRIDNVLYVPGLAFNLLSVLKLVDRGAEVRFAKDRSPINKGDRTILQAGAAHKAWIVDAQRMEHKALRQHHALPATVAAYTSPTGVFTRSGTKASIDIWHRRLAHLGYDSLRLLLSSLGQGASVARSPEPGACEGCVMGKIVRPSFTASSTRAKAPLALVHTDLCDLVTPTTSGIRYALVIVDDYSRYAWVYFLQRKSDVTMRFKEWLPQVERLHDHKVKTIRSDNGGEYINQSFSELLRLQGIVHQTTTPYSSQQNGVAERINRTLVERTVSLLHSKALPIRLWAEVMRTVVYLKNRSPSHTTPRATPYQLLFGEKPNLGHLRVIGCAAYAMILKAHRTSKLHDRAVLCTLLGYSETQKAWRLYDHGRGVVVVSRDVVFDETRKAHLGVPMSVSTLRSMLGGSTGDNIPGASNIDQVSAVEMLEAVGEVDRPLAQRAHQADEAVGAEEAQEAVGAEEAQEAVGAEEAQGLVQAEEVAEVQGNRGDVERVRAPRPKRQTWAWAHDLPAPEPLAPNPHAMTTRSGREVRVPARYSANAAHANDLYEEELDSFLGQPGQPDAHPSDTLRARLVPTCSCCKRSIPARTQDLEVCNAEYRRTGVDDCGRQRDAVPASVMSATPKQ